MCEARPRRARASTHVKTSRRLSDAAQPKRGEAGLCEARPRPRSARASVYACRNQPPSR